MQKDSKFAGFYNSGKFNKMNAWSMSMKMPATSSPASHRGAFIYNLKYRGDKQIAIDPKLDMGANFAQ